MILFLEGKEFVLGCEMKGFLGMMSLIAVEVFLRQAGCHGSL